MHHSAHSRHAMHTVCSFFRQETFAHGGHALPLPNVTATLSCCINVPNKLQSTTAHSHPLQYMAGIDLPPSSRYIKLQGAGCTSKRCKPLAFRGPGVSSSCRVHSTLLSSLCLIVQLRTTTNQRGLDASCTRLRHLGTKRTTQDETTAGRGSLEPGNESIDGYIFKRTKPFPTHKAVEPHARVCPRPNQGGALTSFSQECVYEVQERKARGGPHPAPNTSSRNQRSAQRLNRDLRICRICGSAPEKISVPPLWLIAAPQNRRPGVPRQGPGGTLWYRSSGVRAGSGHHRLTLPHIQECDKLHL